MPQFTDHELQFLHKVMVELERAPEPTMSAKQNTRIISVDLTVPEFLYLKSTVKKLEAQVRGYNAA